MDWFPVGYAFGAAVLAVALSAAFFRFSKDVVRPIGNYDEKKQQVLESAIDFVKVTVGVSVGSLAFGVGLVANATTLSYWVRVYGLTAGVLLVFSAVGGLFALSSLVGKIEERQYGLKDRGWQIPGVAHMLCLGAAVMFLGLALYSMLWDQPDTEAFCAPSQKQLMDKLAEKLPALIPGTQTFYKLTTPELVKGIDPEKETLATWHVQLETADRATQIEARMNDRPARASAGDSHARGRECAVGNTGASLRRHLRRSKERRPPDRFLNRQGYHG